MIYVLLSLTCAVVADLLGSELIRLPRIPLELLLVFVSGGASISTSYVMYDKFRRDIEQEIVLERATSPSDGLGRFNRSHYSDTRSKKRTARFQEDGFVMVPSTYHWSGSSGSFQVLSTERADDVIKVSDLMKLQEQTDTMVTAQGDTIVYRLRQVP